MARLYASIHGTAKTTATRRGRDYIEGHIRGWNLGIEVVGKVEEGRDVFYVYRTGGSSAAVGHQLIAKIEEA